MNKPASELIAAREALANKLELLQPTELPMPEGYYRASYIPRLMAKERELIVDALRAATNQSGSEREALAALVNVVSNMRVPQNVADAALQITIIGPVLECAKAALHSPKIAAAETSPGDAEAAFPAWTNEDEAYQLGRRDGYESAIQDIDIETGGDGEFKGSTIPGETVDVPTMKRRIIDRLDAKAEAKSQEPEAVAWLRNGSCDGSIPFALCDEDDEGAFPVYTHPTTKPEAPAVSVDAETLYSVFHSAYVKHGHGEIGTRAGITAIAALISGER